AQKVLTQWPRCHHDDVPSPHHENLARPHFSTRSRHYSTTMGAIRDERRDHARTDEITTGRLPLFDEDTVLVISHWEYAGKGLSAGDALLAALLSGDPPSPISPDGGGGR
ncbi:replication initiator, partial [Streptosporangium sp. NPDC051023]|uniref:replication initiator n=1 Tax=Streptosporangium sp. NPDC051023 TaxID=3155410 RepID=UPI00344BF2CE